MKRTASVCMALWLAGAAGCGGAEDDAPEQTTPIAQDSGITQDSSASTVTADAGSASDAGGTTTAPEASAPGMTTPKDAAVDTPSKEAGATRPPLMLDIPKSTIQCGGSPCDTLANVCCESWSATDGFGSTQTCLTREECNKKYSRSGDTNRAIPHECDGKEDCSGGQVCCMYAPGMPLCALEDFGDCINKLTGPGGAGICADNDKCKLGTTQFIAEGVPLGILACNDNSDCQDRQGTSCQAEENGSLTAGKGVKARANVKVCR